MSDELDRTRSLLDEATQEAARHHACADHAHARGAVERARHHLTTAVALDDRVHHLRQRPTVAGTVELRAALDELRGLSPTT